jgi:hypothetical protein
MTPINLSASLKSISTASSTCLRYVEFFYEVLACQKEVVKVQPCPEHLVMTLICHCLNPVLHRLFSTNCFDSFFAVVASFFAGAEQQVVVAILAWQMVQVPRITNNKKYHIKHYNIIYDYTSLVGIVFLKPYCQCIFMYSF